MKAEITPFLAGGGANAAARLRVGTEHCSFEQIPAYLEFFGFGTTTPPDELRSVARLQVLTTRNRTTIALSTQ